MSRVLEFEKYINRKVAATKPEVTKRIIPVLSPTPVGSRIKRIDIKIKLLDRTLRSNEKEDAVVKSIFYEWLEHKDELYPCRNVKV